MLPNEPVFTSVLDDVAALRPKPGSLYITGVSVEERSEHTASWEAGSKDVVFARLIGSNASMARLATDHGEYDIQLRDAASIVHFLEARQYSAIYLDITGLPHHIWAPILRAIRSRAQESAFCVYVEPGDYRFSPAPTEAAIFDLSESIKGIRPLPGFVSFPAADSEFLFVPLLGFEGARFAYMLEDVQPRPRDVFPVVGVPGFRPEYPFYTYAGNRSKLSETKAWQNVRFAAANCPFSLYHVLDELSQVRSAQRMIVAPIGTKPHALGAILYCLDHPRETEVLYDHPVRKEKRTLGTSRVCLYDLSFLPRVPKETVAI